MRRRLILRCPLAPGDIVLLTAAVRDLHRCYPGRFVTDVDTGFPDLWEHNPHVTRLDPKDPSVETLVCEYPLINRANLQPHHALHGFLDFLNTRLGLAIALTEFKGDIHLSVGEKSQPPPLTSWGGVAAPFWLVSAGGKYDLTAKWWPVERYQAVVDRFRHRIQFVQVGQAGDYHPRLEGAIDLRGKTTLRQLIRLVYHAQGVLCGVTALMHLAAAVELEGGPSRCRPCVVIAGGREPVHWEAYLGHQFLHTIGALPCCARGGCWKARTFRLGDGDERDLPKSLCVNLAGQIPRCMDLIAADDVVRRIETYFGGGMLHYLTRREDAAAARVERERRDPSFDKQPLHVGSVRMALERALATLPPYPGSFAGRGVVLVGGGPKYFANAWVCLKMLRHWECRLPVQLWHLGPEEMDDTMRALVRPLQVECVDARAESVTQPVRMLNGWILKSYAILRSPFREVLLLDADNVPLVDPTFLFDTPPYAEAGAIFWPDYLRPEPPRRVWEFCGIPFRSEPPFETGQLVIDKQRCWAPLRLALWFNENADFFYQHVYGDKETFHLAFRKLNRPYAMPRRPMQPLTGTMCQHDFAGRRIFQHRNTAKWELFGPNARIEGFRQEAKCLEFLAELARVWSGKVAAPQTTSPPRRSRKCRRTVA